MTTSHNKRLIIVSNRLPFSVHETDGELDFRESAGGLVTGLRSYLESQEKEDSRLDYVWVGWPGNTVSNAVTEQLKARALAEHRSYPVFLTQEEMDNFYFGFCNRTIWPLFHYFPSYTTYEEELWKHYKRVNEIFCNALVDLTRAGDIVWIHDYHLMLLPGMLKAKSPHIPIGFFLHIPFPTFEVFRLLPVRWRREILDGILGADLIGYHTYDYSNAFLQSVLRILGYEHHLGRITLPSRIVRVETFPMGIDFEKIHTAIHDPEVQQERDDLKKTLTDVKVVLSVDRLDYSKGILNRLHGFEILLRTNPQFREKVVLIMVVVPSRIGVEHYELMKKQIEEIVGRINGQFGSVNWTPVIYQFRHLSFKPLTALYSLCDVALVTPLRDGMNLVSKEYVATRSDQTGVLVLSEMAGSAKELGEAIIINPNNWEEIAEALKEALEMPLEEQKRRNQIMQTRLRRYDVVRWANDFVGHLLAMHSEQERFYAKLLPASMRERIIHEYEHSTKRLILLDYDGTLVPFARKPHLATPSADVLRLLRTLSGDPANTVVLISGRDKKTLEGWFGRIPINMVAEHGAWLKKQDGDWRTLKQQANDWKPRILPILELYADRLPGAFVEEKDHSLAWHYRAADPEQGRILAGELMDHLSSFTANINVQVLQGSKVVELRSSGINKGVAGMRWLSKEQYDFILAIGDDWTDEDLFAVLPDTAYSIRVGVTNTQARYNFRNPSDTLQLLESLIHSIRIGVGQHEGPMR
ncbi:MAG: bifunctional alpha,alpha-trehalose-phosphate synthase (UDP-forming)/trehalose-phosphatase [Ignavibacteriae bacterium]|nr:bifunctional alpha,alpha-trehalose-phosphate synthase (UDP-forming)/trehalose-phosphatase [Ignavibacteriota bacterium]